MTQLIVDPITGLIYRDDTYDIKTIRKIKRDCDNFKFKDEWIMDLGAHIGSFSWEAITRGGIIAVAVEAEPANAQIFRRNLPEVNLLEAAVTHLHDPELHFYVNEGAGKGFHSLRETKGRTRITVAAVNIQTLVDKYQPTFIKMDVEGAETDLLEGLEFPTSVKQLFIEWHKVRQLQRCIFNHTNLLEKGFTCHKDPHFESGSWFTFGGYHR